ncbi:1712_t:CDS:2 [Acaulospora morrowiae]|uniref:Glycerol-3-phosphate dehydrogenase n=1 Tax=Acaulospora morrowiae TaxID=94023 RepID=A0A9N8V2P8_9GLOM|nr:1712_t:CDS:2 [Acaulospora morrowiae]
MWKALNKKRMAYAGLAVVAGGTSYYFYNANSAKKRNYQRPSTINPQLFMSETYADANKSVLFDKISDRPHTFWTPPSRKEMLNMLKDSVKESEPVFDILVIGGGATGAGTALDAATRGLKVAMVERDDFASGTSSRSTKLVHGGVRYLEKAFLEFDYGQYKLVREALHERATFLHTAPYLSYLLPIILPIYKWWQVPYFWVGVKVYDFLAGTAGEKLESSYFSTRSKTLEAFPWLKKEKLVGALVYYDGQHNDARMNVALALTAISYGAVVANHVEVMNLLKDDQGKVVGAHVRDTLTNEEWDIRSKGVINATGAFTDGIRSMDNPKTEKIVQPSSGVHIVLPNYYSPRKMGLLDPQTSDGRVIFFLPWEGATLAGTTDSPTELTYNPMPKEEEIQWILEEVKRYLSPDIKVRRSDVLAAWSGIRPLVRDPSAKNTAALVRSHMIDVSETNLITISGGKWTTYRNMAKETVDVAVKVLGLNPLNDSLTERAKLIGSHGYSNTTFIKLIQQFGIETEIAQHLARSYGDRAWAVAALSKPTGKRWPVFGQRISPSYPYIEAEVRYAVRREYACTLVDVIARRTRLAFINAQATLESLPRIIDIMSEELGWSPERQTREFDQAVDFLQTMGLPKQSEKMTIDKIRKESKALIREAPYNQLQFQPEELASFQKAFSDLDKSGEGQIKFVELERALTLVGVSVPEQVLTTIITQMNLKGNESIEYGEFLEIVGGIKEHLLSKITNDDQMRIYEQKRIPIERSSGGV